MINSKMREIDFGTKEELKLKREKRFLALDPNERIISFLEMIRENYIFFGKKENDSDNFIIERKG